MPRLTPQSWKKLQKVFQLYGYSVERQTDNHLVLSKPGVARPVVIPKYDAVGLDVIKNNLRTAGMSRETFLALLGQV